MWDAHANSFEENARYCLVRAIEWSAWPLFVAQPVIPIALLYWPWWNVMATLLAVSVFWMALVRDNIVVPLLAHWGCFFVKLKWLTCPIGGITLAHRGTFGIAALALLWPLATLPLQSILLALYPARIGDLQGKFMQCLGYRPAPTNNS